MPTASEFQQMLRGVSLRVTRPRVAVLSAVHDHPHADTESIIRAVRSDLPEVSHQTVYDSLNALTATGWFGVFSRPGRSHVTSRESATITTTSSAGRAG